MWKKWLILFNLLNIPYKKVKTIVSLFSSGEEFAGIKEKDLSEIPILTPQERRSILIEREGEKLLQELKTIKNEGIEILDIFDSEYPPLLRQIPSPPYCLYIKGKKDTLKKPCFAIVGTRTPTFYGTSMTEKFAYILSSLGLVIVSGLARGIDTYAHRGALKGGSTIAVLGSGLLRIYPPENQKLAKEIETQGLIVSEFPLNTPPYRTNFPRRNRIISGLSWGVLVAEASKRSGALITASLALDYNREVFALPGKVDSPFSKGTHYLIKEGAKLVEDVNDIIDELNVEFNHVFTQDTESTKQNTTKSEQEIIAVLKDKETYLEELALKVNLGRDEFNKALLSLQLKGIIKEIKPNLFVLRSI